MIRILIVLYTVVIVGGDMNQNALIALRSFTRAIADVQGEAEEIQKIVARRYYWEQLTIRAKVQASGARAIALASHPMGGWAVLVAVNRMAAAREEVKRCLKQLDAIYDEMHDITAEALVLAQRATLKIRTKDQKVVETEVTYKHPRIIRDEEDEGKVSRKVPMRLVYWICVVCGTEHYEVRYPNKIPVYCPPLPEEADYGLMSECQRKGLADTQHKYHVRQRLESDAFRRQAQRDDKERKQRVMRDEKE